MKRKLAWIGAAVVGLLLAPAGLFGMQESAADPDVCVHAEAGIGSTTTIVHHEDNCPPIPPDPDHPCPGGIAVLQDVQVEHVKADVFVCARGI